MKLDKKDFVRWLIQEILDKKEKNGCDILDIWSQTLCTRREYSTIQKKNAKVPNFIINKAYHMGHFLWDMRRHSEMP